MPVSTRSHSEVALAPPLPPRTRKRKQAPREIEAPQPPQQPRLAETEPVFSLAFGTTKGEGDGEDRTQNREVFSHLLSYMDNASRARLSRCDRTLRELVHDATCSEERYLQAMPTRVLEALLWHTDNCALWCLALTCRRMLFLVRAFWRRHRRQLLTLCPYTLLPCREEYLPARLSGGRVLEGVRDGMVRSFATLSLLDSREPDPLRRRSCTVCVVYWIYHEVEDVTDRDVSGSAKDYVDKASTLLHARRLRLCPVKSTRSLNWMFAQPEGIIRGVGAMLPPQPGSEVNIYLDARCYTGAETHAQQVVTFCYCVREHFRRYRAAEEYELAQVKWGHVGPDAPSIAWYARLLARQNERRLPPGTVRVPDLGNDGPSEWETRRLRPEVRHLYDILNGSYPGEIMTIDWNGFRQGHVDRQPSDSLQIYDSANVWATVRWWGQRPLMLSTRSQGEGLPWECLLQERFLAGWDVATRLTTEALREGMRPLNARAEPSLSRLKRSTLEDANSDQQPMGVGMRMLASMGVQCDLVRDGDHAVCPEAVYDVWRRSDVAAARHLYRLNTITFEPLARHRRDHREGRWSSFHLDTELPARLHAYLPRNNTWSGADWAADRIGTVHAYSCYFDPGAPSSQLVPVAERIGAACDLFRFHAGYFVPLGQCPTQPPFILGRSELEANENEEEEEEEEYQLSDEGERQALIQHRYSLRGTTLNETCAQRDFVSLELSEAVNWVLRQLREHRLLPNRDSLPLSVKEEVPLETRRRVITNCYLTLLLRPLWGCDAGTAEGNSVSLLFWEPPEVNVGLRERVPVRFGLRLTLLPAAAPGHTLDLLEVHLYEMCWENWRPTAGEPFSSDNIPLRERHESKHAQVLTTGLRRLADRWRAEHFQQNLQHINVPLYHPDR